MPMQHHHNPSGHRPNNTPRALPAVGSPLATSAKTSAPGSFLQWYNVHLNLWGHNGTTYSEWEGISNLFLWMQEIDKTIELLPWAVKDHDHNLPIVITSIPQVFFNFHTYAPGLASLQVSLRSQLELGDVRHPLLFL